LLVVVCHKNNNNIILILIIMQGAGGLFLMAGRWAGEPARFACLAAANKAEGRVSGGGGAWGVQFADI